MKSVVFFCLLFLCSISARSESVPVYYTAVDMPAFLKNQYYGRFDPKILAEDLAQLLSKATGSSFIAQNSIPGKTTGIFLILDNRMPSDDPEAGIVESNGRNIIRIRARYTTGLSYALYSWLHDKGFRFYLPGESWTVIPELPSVFTGKPSSKTYRPAFSMRMFLASGGTYAVKGLDEQKLMELDWRQWHQRNRMGCAYISVDGHMGETFNLANKDVIEKEPGILAPVKGKSAYRTDGKLDPTNNTGVELFSNWIVQEHKKKQENWPSFLPKKKYFSADMGDGLNYCETNECRKQFRSVSDQAFHIINTTAKQMKRADPDGGVSTLAYTERADTPHIAIEPNVHVMVVPTAFQYVSTPANLMQRWAKKSSHVSQYDYLNIGVWAWDKPFFNLYDYHHYLQFLQQLKVEGLHYETSLSKFASGIQQYVILNFLCEPYTSVDTLLDEFCRMNFGKAAEPVKQILKEWYFSSTHLKTNYDHPSFYEDELGRFFVLLEKAEKTTGLSRKQQSNLDELKAYTVYLCQYFELFADLPSQNTFSANPALKKQKVTEILEYSWGLYHSRIFQNTQLNDLYKNMLDETERASWDYHHSARFSQITKGSEAKTAYMYQQYKTRYLLYAETFTSVSDAELDRISAYAADSFRITSMDEAAFGHFMYPLTLYCRKPGKIQIRYLTKQNTGQVYGQDKVSLISLESADYRHISTQTIRSGNSTGKMEFNLPKKGHYRLYLAQYQATPVECIIYPRGNLFYHAKKSIMMNGIRMQEPDESGPYANRYIGIYTPTANGKNHLRFSSLYASSTNTSRFRTADGKKLTPVLEKERLSYIIDNLPTVSSQPFIYYENPVYRWPPVIKNSTSLYLYLKAPKGL